MASQSSKQAGVWQIVTHERHAAQLGSLSQAERSALHASAVHVAHPLWGLAFAPGEPGHAATQRTSSLGASGASPGRKNFDSSAHVALSATMQPAMQDSGSCGTVGELQS